MKGFITVVDGEVDFVEHAQYMEYIRQNAEDRLDELGGKDFDPVQAEKYLIDQWMEDDTIEVDGVIYSVNAFFWMAYIRDLIKACQAIIDRQE